MLKAFKEIYVFKGLSSLFHNDGAVYDKVLKPWFVLQWGSFNFW